MSASRNGTIMSDDDDGFEVLQSNVNAYGDDEPQRDASSDVRSFRIGQPTPILARSHCTDTLRSSLFNGVDVTESMTALSTAGDPSVMMASATDRTLDGLVASDALTLRSMLTKSTASTEESEGSILDVLDLQKSIERQNELFANGVKDLKDIIVEKDDKIDELQRSIQKLVEANNTQNEVATLKKQLGETSSQLVETKEQLVTYKRLYEEVRTTWSATKEAIAQDNEKARHEIEELKTREQELLQEIEHLRRGVKEEFSLLGTNPDNTSSVEIEQLKNLLAESEARYAQLEASHKATNDMVSIPNTLTLNTEGSESEKDVEIAKLKKTVDEREEELAETRMRVSNLEAIINVQHEDSVEATRILAEKDHEINAFKAQIEQFRLDRCEVNH